jgi:hypothetical protein
MYAALIATPLGRQCEVYATLTASLRGVRAAERCRKRAGGDRVRADEIDCPSGRHRASQLVLEPGFAAIR